MSHRLKDVFRRIVEAEAFDTPEVLEIHMEVQALLLAIERQAGPELYQHMELTIVRALEIKEEAGFIVGYLYAQEMAAAACS